MNDNFFNNLIIKKEKWIIELNIWKRWLMLKAIEEITKEKLMISTKTTNSKGKKNNTF